MNKHDKISDQRANNEAALIDALVELGDDEIRVLLVLATRLKSGQDRYGKLDVANDKRDFRVERGEEVQDLLVYSAFIELRDLTRK